MNIKKLLGMRIKEIRKNKNLSQEKLAEKADINAKYLSRIELGIGNPTLDLFIKLTNALEIEMWEMFDFGHFEISNSNTKKAIHKIISLLDTERLHIVLKVIRAIVR